MLKSPIYTVLVGFVLLAVLAWVTYRSGDDPADEITTAPGMPGNPVKPSTFQAVCATCHGEMGEGKKELMSPSIASLPRWYVEEQIKKFRNGQRGAHPQDIHGQQMRAAISELTDDQLVDALDEIEKLPALGHAQTLTGDPEKGYQLYYENCMSCHRFNGHGEIVFHSASLNGLQDWYLLEQINKFQQGIRGYHPDDMSGVKMRTAVGHIANDQDKLDIVAQLTLLAKKYPVVKNPKPDRE